MNNNPADTPVEDFYCLCCGRPGAAVRGACHGCGGCLRFCAGRCGTAGPQFHVRNVRVLYGMHRWLKDTYIREGVTLLSRNDIESCWTAAARVAETFISWCSDPEWSFGHHILSRVVLALPGVDGSHRARAPAVAAPAAPWSECRPGCLSSGQEYRPGCCYVPAGLLPQVMCSPLEQRGQRSLGHAAQPDAGPCRVPLGAV
jgi:hypothetical protein